MDAVSEPARQYDGRCRHCYASVASYLDTEKTLHEAAAGAKCHDDGNGFCLTCGVEMTVCNVCNGIGYHREGCTLIGSEAP